MVSRGPLPLPRLDIVRRGGGWSHGRRWAPRIRRYVARGKQGINGAEGGLQFARSAVVIARGISATAAAERETPDGGAMKREARVPKQRIRLCSTRRWLDPLSRALGSRA